MLRRFYILARAILESRFPLLVDGSEMRNTRYEIVLVSTMSKSRYQAAQLNVLLQQPAQRRVYSGRSESALWMLADMQAVMNGEAHAPQELVIEEYRLLVRHAVLSLPPGAIVESPEPWHLSEGDDMSLEKRQADQFVREYSERISAGPAPQPGEMDLPPGWWSRPNPRAALM